MNPKRRNQIAKLVDGILEQNTLKRPPIELLDAIMKQRGIKFKELDENDEEFCGVYIVVESTKIIFVNSNLYTPRKNFTIAHELGHHFLGHTLTDGAIICDKTAMDTKNNNRPEEEKEADYFATCLLMPGKLIREQKKTFDESYTVQTALFVQTEAQAKNDELIKFLSNWFKVSKEAMGYRLNELGII